MELIRAALRYGTRFINIMEKHKDAPNYNKDGICYANRSDEETCCLYKPLFCGGAMCRFREKAICNAEESMDKMVDKIVDIFDCTKGFMDE